MADHSAASSCHQSSTRWSGRTEHLRHLPAHNTRCQSRTPATGAQPISRRPHSDGCLFSYFRSRVRTPEACWWLANSAGFSDPAFGLPCTLPRSICLLCVRDGWRWACSPCRGLFLFSSSLTELAQRGLDLACLNGKRLRLARLVATAGRNFLPLAAAPPFLAIHVWTPLRSRPV